MTHGWRILELTGALLFGTGCAFATQAAEAKVFLYEHGTRREVRDVQRERIIQMAEEQLRFAGDVARLAVSKMLIDQIRASELAIEILYPKSISIVLANFGGRAVTFRRLLIPLSGDLAGGVTTILVGEDEYRSGPYRNRSGTGHFLGTLRPN